LWQEEGSLFGRKERGRRESSYIIIFIIFFESDFLCEVDEKKGKERSFTNPLLGLLCTRIG